MTTLLIVESPSKCKKIESFLGTGYKVLASYGHFTKLNDLSQINYETYDIEYKVDKTKILNQLKSECKKAKEVIIATDDDREGEAIGWAICIFCKLDLKKTKKIVFQEITKSAILNALNNPTHVNMDIVKSQQARQILDLYLGYKISPLLWKYIQNKLSAGRCQTPALKLVYDNEIEIQNDTPESLYKIEGFFTDKNIKFECNEQVDKTKINDFINFIVSLNNDQWIISNKKEKNVTESPPQILITSSLQQRAYNQFGYSPKMTMKYAQELYENGFITYMRTDSACYSQEFINKLSDHITSQYGPQYLSSKIQSLRFNNNKKGKTQDAHEGIRVTNLKTTALNKCTDNAKKLYKYIYDNCLQTGMQNASHLDTIYSIAIKSDEMKREYCFCHVIRYTTFLGFKIVNDAKTTTTQQNQTNKLFLNTLYETKTPVAVKYIQCNETQTRHKSRYNESSLIKSLENRGIGRPSTFSNIIHSLIDRKYVEKKSIEGNEVEIINYTIQGDVNHSVTAQKTKKTFNSEKNKLIITPLGSCVIEFCFKYFEPLFDFDFTSNMENQLDDIANRETRQDKVLKDYIEKTNNMIQESKTNMKDNTKKYKDNNSIHCGSYNEKPIFIKHGPYGYYVEFGNKEKVSLKEFEGFDIQDKIKKNINELTESERSTLIKFIESGKNNNNNILIHLSDECSIRRSKYGIYIYYKEPKMKKPKFLKYNDEKDDEIQGWVENGNLSEIKSYIGKKYKIIL